MSNNYSAKDSSTGSDKAFKSTENTGVHTPHKNIDVIAPGASADLGTTTDAAVADDTGSVNSHVRSAAKSLDEKLPPLGPNGQANAVPTVLADDHPDLPPLGAGTNTIGAVKNAGPNWTQAFKVSSSADLTTIASITDAPDSGQHLVMESVVISAATAMIVTLKEETSNTIVKVFNLTAGNLNAEWNPANGLRLPTADKKLRAISDTAGQIDITVISHSAA